LASLLMMVKIFLDSFLSLAILVCQLLKGLLTKDVFLKKFFTPFCGSILFYKLATAILTLKQLSAITGFTVFDYIIRLTLNALFLGIKFE